MPKLDKKIVSYYDNPKYSLSLIDSILPNPSKIINAIYQKGEYPYDVYLEMLHDATILAELQSIKAGLESYQNRVVFEEETGDLKVLELCQKTVNEQSNTLNWEIYKAILYGFRIFQITYKPYQGFLIPDKIFPIPNYMVGFDIIGKPLIITTTHPEGISLTDKKYNNRWFMVKHLDDEINPYGIALLDACYWYWLFKKEGVKSLALHVEHFSNPPVYANVEHDVDISSEEINTYLQQLHLMGTGVFPTGIDIKNLELDSPSEAPNKFINLLNNEMSKIFTGQAQVAEQTQSTGSRASSEVSERRAEQISVMRREMVSNAWSLIFKSIVNINFTNYADSDSIPKYEFYIEEKPRQNWAEYFTEVSKHGVIPISKEYYYDKLRIEPPKNDNDKIILSKDKQINEVDELAEFASQEETKLESLANKGAIEYSKEITGESIQELSDELDNAKSLTAYRDTIEEMYQVSSAKKKALK